MQPVQHSVFVGIDQQVVHQKRQEQKGEKKQSAYNVVDECKRHHAKQVANDDHSLYKGEVVLVIFTTF